ncbi:methyl-accepting chemotaxis protein [Pseudomonas sp. Pseusp97]|uniref:methyl-accepting chemotaxis protein n=1 Tax=Pseudomonas sp. Pseusp97 TaxID=3243065 RepID=UPI0039A6A65C
MNQPRSRIALQLAMALAVLLILLISGSTLFALRSLDSATLTTREEHLASEARLLADQLETFHGTLRESTQRLAGLFEQRFAAGLKAHAEERVPVAALQAPALYLGDARLNGDFTLVDEFRQLTAGVATVFVRDGEDFVRITTSLTKQDGSRAMGTVLDHNSPAYPLLMRGESYVGRALLFDRFYMTQYTPVRDAGGRVIAVLFVGFDYTDAQKRQFDNLGRFRLGQRGSLALLDEQHHWLVPPAGARNPERAADSLASLLDNPGRGRFWSDGQGDFYSVAQPFAGGPWTVVASMPKDEIRAVTWRVGGQLAMGSLIAMLLAVIATTWLLRRRLRPLGDLVRQVADLVVTGNRQARSFNQMGEALSSMVARVRGAAEEVGHCSRTLSGLSSGAYAGMEQQSGEINSMAGAVEEFSATSMDIADNMRSTERMASENTRQTHIGLQSMDDASASLAQIAGALQQTVERVNRLGARSQEIGSIVGVITSIAEQTNLLALNAAIEAARAGEQGRGFAVVADEVRSLAARTQAATTEISQMIGAIQQDTGSATETIEQGSQLMQHGLALNEKVAAALAEISQQSSAAGEQFAAITTATQEQSRTATLLSSNLQGIAQANSEQRQVVADLAQTVRELDSLAAGLRDEVGRFR